MGFRYHRYMKTLPTLTVIALVFQLSLAVLAQDTKEMERQKELHLRGSSKVMVTPSTQIKGASKVMVTPRPPVPNRTQLPANFESLKDARRQQRRYLQQSVRDRWLNFRPYCSHQQADPALHPNHRCSEQAAWEAEYRHKHGRDYKEPEVLRPYPEESSLERPFAEK